MTKKTEVEYKVSFTNTTAEKKKSFKDSKCIITISVGQPAHEGKKFQATLDLVNKSFKECMIVLCDTLQRYSIAIKISDKNPEELYEFSKKEGDKWLDRNQNAIKSLTIPYKITRWDEWLNDIEFIEYHRKVCDLYDNDSEYFTLANKEVQNYIDRLLKKEINLDLNKAKKYSLEYIKEECAAMCLWTYNGYSFEIYPSIRNESISATYSKTICNNNYIYPIGLQIKRRTQEYKNNTRVGNMTLNLSDLIYDMPGHVYWKDNKGVYMGCNDRQAQSLGLKLGSEVIGKTDFELPWGYNYGDKIRKNDIAIMNSGNSSILEESVNLGNKEIVMLSHKVPIKDERGNVEGILGVSIDITAQKEKEKFIIRENRTTKVALENIIDNVPGHIYWKNKKGEFLGCNTKQAQSYGINNVRKIIGKTDIDLLGIEVGSKIKKNDFIIMNNGHDEVIEEKTIIDNKNVVMLSQKSPLKDSYGNIVGVLGVSMDITKQKNLEKKYVERLHELNHALEIKRDILSNVSHEIKTPLHSMTNIAKEVYKQWPSLDDPSKRKYLKTIIDNQDRLVSLLDDMIDLSKLQAGKVNFEFNEHDVIALLTEVVEEFKYITSSINIDINPSLSIAIAQCDEKRIKQVLRNIISNAIKFSTKNKPIDINIYPTSEDVLKVSIADHGIGIPEEDMLRIFDPFEESSRTKSMAGGKGFGLAICRDIIIAHRGEITVKANKGAGSIFYFSIPIKRAADKKHIVVIDDEVSILQSISLVLMGLGYDVTELESGREALDYFEHGKKKVDLVLLDMMIPDMYGLDILKHFKSYSKFKDVPVVIQSGIGLSEEIDKALEIGAVDSLCKPYDSSDLEKKLNKYLGATEKVKELV